MIHGHLERPTVTLIGADTPPSSCRSPSQRRLRRRLQQRHRRSGASSTRSASRQAVAAPLDTPPWRDVFRSLKNRYGVGWLLDIASDTTSTRARPRRLAAATPRASTLGAQDGWSNFPAPRVRIVASTRSASPQVALSRRALDEGAPTWLTLARRTSSGASAGSPAQSQPRPRGCAITTSPRRKRIGVRPAAVAVAADVAAPDAGGFLDRGGDPRRRYAHLGRHVVQQVGDVEVLDRPQDGSRQPCRARRAASARWPGRLRGPLGDNATASRRRWARSSPSRAARRAAAGSRAADPRPVARRKNVRPAWPADRDQRPPPPASVQPQRHRR